MANAQSYSSKSTAIRGAKRAGYENPVAYQGEDGKWYISDAGEVLGKADDFEASEAELAAQVVRPSVETFTAKIENVQIVETNQGVKLAVVELVDVKPVTTEEAPAAPAKMKSYKQVANYNKSSKESPVKFIHEFLSANPTLSRKAAVIALTSEHGINYSTARTQYQRWFTANKAAK